MEQFKIDLFISTKQEYFPASQIPSMRDTLQNLDDSRYSRLEAMDLKKPSTMLIISIFAGGLGIDRFMLGQSGLGVGKLLTCGGLGIWTIIDWFKIQEDTKKLNAQKFMQNT